MSLFDKQSLLSELTDRTEVITSNTKSFLRLSNDELNFKPSPQAWSVAEIYGHLNIINKNYISEILKKVLCAKDVDINHCSSGWLGDMIYEKLMPRADGTVYKAKSPKNYFSVGEKQNPFKILDEFIERQNELYDILQHSASKDLDHIHISFHYSKLLKFNLCDSFRFIIAHNERHLMQAYRLMEKMPVLQKG